MVFVPGALQEGGYDFGGQGTKTKWVWQVEEGTTGALCLGKVGKNHLPPPHATMEACVEVSSLMRVCCAWPWVAGDGAGGGSVPKMHHGMGCWEMNTGQDAEEGPPGRPGQAPRRDASGWNLEEVQERFRFTMSRANGLQHCAPLLSPSAPPTAPMD